MNECEYGAMVEWYLQGNPEVLANPLSHCHLIHHKSHTHWPKMVFPSLCDSRIQNNRNNRIPSENDVTQVYTQIVSWVFRSSEMLRRAYRRFGTVYEFHLQGSSSIILGLLEPWRWDGESVRKPRWQTNSIRYVTSQKSEGLKNAAVEASNLAHSELCN